MSKNRELYLLVELEFNEINVLLIWVLLHFVQKLYRLIVFKFDDKNVYFNGIEGKL